MTDDDFDELLRMTGKDPNEIQKSRPKTADSKALPSKYNILEN
jgi:hypothetical protein